MTEQTMSEQQELIKAVPVSKIEGLTALQKGWVRLADLKVLVSDKLTKSELEIQNLLKDADKQDLKKLQDNLKKAKSVAAEAKDARLYFTNMVKEKITEPLMAFEGRNDLIISTANQAEFHLRKTANEKAEKEQERNNEIAMFKAHIKNEWLRLGAEYRSRLAKLISDAYTTALKDKVPLDTIENYIKQIHNFLCKEKLGSFTKFERKHITDSEAQQIFAEIPGYKGKPDLEVALEKLQTTFLTYENDLANSKKAIAAEQRRQKEEATAEAERVEMEAATNKLVAEAGDYQIVSGEEGNTIIKTHYEVEDQNTKEWAFAVIAAFMGNMNALLPYIKTKTFNKITIGQMATAIGKLHTERNTKFPSLNFKPVEK